MDVPQSIYNIVKLLIGDIVSTAFLQLITSQKVTQIILYTIYTSFQVMPNFLIHLDCMVSLRSSDVFFFFGLGVTESNAAMTIRITFV